LHVFGKIQALRSLAPVLSTLLLAFYAGLGIWAYRLLGFDTGLHAYDAKVLPAPRRPPRSGRVDDPPPPWLGRLESMV
jgi:hypothetical protein